jgi:hypothetical protein
VIVTHSDVFGYLSQLKIGIKILSYEFDCFFNDFEVSVLAHLLPLAITLFQRKMKAIHFLLNLGEREGNY